MSKTIKHFKIILLLCSVFFISCSQDKKLVYRDYAKSKADLIKLCEELPRPKGTALANRDFFDKHDRAVYTIEYISPATNEEIKAVYEGTLLPQSWSVKERFSFDPWKWFFDLPQDMKLEFHKE